MNGELFAGQSRRLVVLNLGAGRQSVALLAMAIAGEIERPDLVIHADTGHERTATYRYMRDVVVPRCKAAGLPLLIVNNGSIRDDTLASVREGSRVANAPYWADKGNGQRGPLMRLCTSEYKLVPIRRAIRAHLGVKNGCPVYTKAHPWHVDQWIGIATEESDRAKGKSGVCWSSLSYPLLDLDMSTADCIAKLHELGWPIPVKSACIACPFRSDSSWARLKIEAPADFAEAVAFDAELRAHGRLNARYQGGALPIYVHESCKPLGEITFTDDGSGDAFGGAFC